MALGLAVLGRFLRAGLVAAAAGGVGVLAGWFVLTGRLWAVPPPVSVDALTGLAAATLLIGLLCAWRGHERLTAVGMLAAALIAGWLMAGAPRHLAALRGSWPIGLGVALAAFVFARALTDPTRLALAGLTLAAALHIAGTPPDLDATGAGARVGCTGNVSAARGGRACGAAGRGRRCGPRLAVGYRFGAPAATWVRTGRCRRTVTAAGGLAPAASRGAVASASVGQRRWPAAFWRALSLSAASGWCDSSCATRLR